MTKTLLKNPETFRWQTYGWLVNELNRENELRKDEKIYHVLTWGAIICALFLMAGGVIYAIGYIKNGFTLDDAVVMRDYTWIWFSFLLALLICLSVRISIKSTW